MTTSDAPPQRIWVVGNSGSGKRSLVAALGGATKKPTRGEGAFVEFAWKGVTIALGEDAARWRGECARADVVVLLFDLTDRASFEAAAKDWAPLVSKQTRTLLVGTKLDRVADRAVAASDAMELALVECDDFVEVCASRPPFEGVVYARQLLATWLSQDEASSSSSSSSASSSPSRSPLSSPSLPQKLGARSSVWLYDPTEELTVAGHEDVKLRPISRALFEMREAGSDRVKTQDRRREQAVAKHVGRSRYHGPTESSRSMRWQAHQLQQQQLQQQQQQQQRHRRQSTTDLHLEPKSFLQPTKLMQQRVDEIRSKLLANSTDKPPSRRKVHKHSADRQSERARRPRANSSHPAPPPVPALTGTTAPTRRRTPSLSLSPHRTPSHTRDSFQLNATIAELESDEVVLDLLSPPLAPLLTTVTSPSKKQEEPKVKEELPRQETQRVLSKADQENEKEEDEIEQHHGRCISTEIDEMLDYFDGVTLPL